MVCDPYSVNTFDLNEYDSLLVSSVFNFFNLDMGKILPNLVAYFPEITHIFPGNLVISLILIYKFPLPVNYDNY